MAAEVGDFCTFWRRNKGEPSENVQCEVLEVIPPDWAFIRRLDTGEERQIDLKRLTVVKLASVKED
jgi:hypothetical protein